jgi:hypothetical protein
VSLEERRRTDAAAEALNAPVFGVAQPAPAFGIEQRQSWDTSKRTVSNSFEMQDAADGAPCLLIPLSARRLL